MKQTNAGCRRRSLPASRAGVIAPALLASVLAAGFRAEAPADKLGQDVSVTVIDYWRRHSDGADFFTFDGWLEGWPPGGKTEDWMMGRTTFFGDLTKQFRTMTGLPGWISEFYGGRSKNPPFTAANHASCYYYSLRSGARLALLWHGPGLEQLFTRTETADGGQPTPHCSVVQVFNRHFGPGTQLCRTKSSSEDIEVRASRAKIMLINKRPDAVKVRLDGKELSLAGYEVRVVDTSFGVPRLRGSDRSFPPEGGAPNNGAEVTVTVDYNVPSVVSQLEIGVTHTQATWENGHPEAVARVKKQLEEAGIRYQNQHLMGWGANNPEPSPGVYSWSSLDRRLELIRSMAHTVPVITFCTAPGWMKASGKDWNMEERVADEHVQDFADLCRAVALRYRDVEYFQIWNEFKGYWIKGGRDAERFTVLYNAVYDAVKAARPEAKIGGPYLSMGGRDLSANDWQVLDYWRQHSRGSDFFTFDGWLEGWPPGGKTEDWMMGRTGFFGDLVKEFQTMTDRPVWISEFYGGRSKNPQFTAANHASCYYHALQNGARLALLWDGVGLGQLFTRTQTADGGRPTPHCLVVQAFNRHFGPGTQLYQTKSSSDGIEVLASRKKIMLINKRPDAVTVRLEGKELPLAGYEVRILEAP